MTTPTQPAAPPLILIIPQAALATMPAATLTDIQGCEKQYKAGMYYVTVPPAIYAAWREMEPTP